MNDHVLSEEAFFEAWIGQSVFHRSRLAATAAARLADTQNDGMRLSLMLDLVSQYVQALEDYCIWSCAIRKSVAESVRIDDVLDSIRVDWAHVVSELQKAELEAYRDLWALPTEAADPADQTAYTEQLRSWASVGAEVARTLDARTPGGSRLMNRVLNKTKHGLYVSGAYSGEDLYLVFHPEAAGGRYSVQRVDADEALRFAVQTYSMSKLLGGTLQQVFASWYGRIPDGPWVDAIRRGADELSLEGIIEITTTVAIPRFADVENAVSE